MGDVERPDSLSNQFRARRFQLFEKLVESMPKPIEIIDFGGTVNFWKQRNWAGREGINITLVNLNPQPQEFSNITPIVGDATNLSQFPDNHFDIAFSNSVIEHLFDLPNQIAMGREMQRVARAYWLQTPNFWFPMEPHFQIVGWQWLPEAVRIQIIRRWSCGWRGRTKDPVKAREIVREVRLMTKAELKRAFNDGQFVAEKFFGLTKSWMVFGGFPKG
jgi:hypothetical protein